MAFYARLLTNLLCIVNISAMLYSSDSMSETVIQRCSDQLVELVTCLREETSLIYKLRKCDDYLANTFICLTMKPDISFMRAQQEAIDNGDTIVIKRGLGRCIHKCLQGQGRMNFIQCKSMCHR